MTEAPEMYSPPSSNNRKTAFRPSHAEETHEPVALTAKPHAFAGAILAPKHARELTPSLCLAIASALSEQPHRKSTVVPYTLWITEAWRVLGWAEPSAALFWEMATLYHALFLASSSMDPASSIPPILSCGSASSVGSGTTTDRTIATVDRKKFSAAASAKELPSWLVGTFLLLHCEELVHQRNLSGHDERRFFASESKASASKSLELSLKAGAADFTSLLQHSALSPRTRLHAGWNHDNTHCTAYLLRHLRKILLLSAVPHNPDAVHACMHLAALSSPPPQPSRRTSSNRKRYSLQDIRRQHDEEHGQVGLNVRLTLDDLERLQLVLQPPQGGGIDDPPIRMGQALWTLIYGETSPPPPMATVPLADVEQEIRTHLELELASADASKLEESPSGNADQAASALAKLSLNDDKAQLPDNEYQKELSYLHLRGTTIVLKPNSEAPSSGASSASAENMFGGSLNSSQRLHDLVISECSDAHFYLLQPFEHVTISECTGCTIVVGAVAGLLHVVDCERTSISSAGRRILVSNSAFVQLSVFTPTPPLLVGDNRTCQFAPYNTYYDGLREDLVATGLALAVVPENQSPYHGGRGPENEMGWPPLQCASNKWKYPIELSKLEMPPVPSSGTNSPQTPSSSPSSPGADDKAMTKTSSSSDATLQAPVLVPVTEFNVLFVPVESEAQRQRRLEPDEETEGAEQGSPGSNYCKVLGELLQLSPFRMPAEYEKQLLMKTDRIQNIQEEARKSLTPEQLKSFEEELNRGFRDWLVTSGNLRQVLDLVHLEKRENDERS